jgi:hypothetical protein
VKNQCKRCEGRSFIYDVLGQDIGKLTVPQMFERLTKVECKSCEGTGVEIPVVNIKTLRELQAAS